MTGEQSRELPHDPSAEMAALGAMLHDPAQIPVIGQIAPAEDFHVPRNEEIATALYRLYEEGKPTDSVSLASHFMATGRITKMGGAPYLHTLMGSVATAANGAYHAQIVRRHAQQRLIASAGSWLLQAGTHPGTDLDDIPELLAKSIDRLRETLQRVPLATIPRTGELLEEALTATEKPDSTPSIKTGFPDLDEVYNGHTPGHLIIIGARPSVGKALALDTPLPTPTGWTTMGAVRVGDDVIGADGKPCTVTAATDVMQGRPCFEVEFSDGSVIVADAEHLWLTDTRASLKSAQAAATGYNRTRNQRTFPAVRTTAEIAATLRCESADRRLNHSIANGRALQTPDAELLVAPYTLGAWLGDGDSNGAAVTTPDQEVLDEITREGYRVHRPKADRTGLRYRIQLPDVAPVANRACIACGSEFRPNAPAQDTCGRSCGMSRAAREARQGTTAAKPTCPDCGKPFTGFVACQECHDDHGTLQAQLRKIGVLNKKHIPAEYLRASEAQRRALLAGLLDTDGYCSKSGLVQFAVTRERLARDTFELVLSLGYKPTLTSKPARLNGKICGTAWTVTFTTADRVFRLPRKRDRLRDKVSPLTGRRFIMDVRPVKSVPVRCIQVDSDDRLYLAGRTWIPTHNTVLATDLARNAAIVQQIPTLFATLEVNTLEVMQRLLAAQSRVNLTRIIKAQCTDDDWARLGRGARDLADAPLHIHEPASLTLGGLRQAAEGLKRTTGLGLIIVDYLQLMTGGKAESRQQQVSEITRGLQHLARDLKIPVIACAQINRGPEGRTDKRPMMSDLRESGEMEAAANTVLLLHREDMYEPESPRAGELDVIIAKQRSGQRGTVTLAFQGHYARCASQARDAWTPSSAVATTR